MKRIEKKIVLIDGEQLTQLMIDNSVGVAEIPVCCEPAPMRIISSRNNEFNGKNNHKIDLIIFSNGF